jgi:hypothetical protein
VTPDQHGAARVSLDAVFQQEGVAAKSHLGFRRALARPGEPSWMRCPRCAPRFLGDASIPGRPISEGWTPACRPLIAQGWRDYPCPMRTRAAASDSTASRPR